MKSFSDSFRACRRNEAQCFTFHHSSPAESITEMGTAMEEYETAPDQAPKVEV